MQKTVKNQTALLISNGLLRLVGNIVKTLSYPSTPFFPKSALRFPNSARPNANPTNQAKLIASFGKPTTAIK